MTSHAVRIKVQWLEVLLVLLLSSEARGIEEGWREGRETR